MKLVLRDDADPQEVVEEVDYDFDHDDILQTEIVDVYGSYPYCQR